MFNNTYMPYVLDCLHNKNECAEATQRPKLPREINQRWVSKKTNAVLITPPHKRREGWSLNVHRLGARPIQWLSIISTNYPTDIKRTHQSR